MRSRWWVAVAVVLCALARTGAQPVPPAAPTELPPLVPVPKPDAPLAEVPRPGSMGEYDHGYLYLPERLPERRVPSLCGPAGRWWVSPSLELAFASERRAPGNVRLAALVPGALVPIGERNPDSFVAALGLTAGRWFGEDNTRGVEAGLFVRDANDTFFAGAPGAVVLFSRGNNGRGNGRGAPVAVALTNPNAVGAFPVTLGTFFATAELNYRENLLCAPEYRLDAVAGYRFAYLGDELYIGDLPDGDDAFRLNRAAVTNTFHGAQIGLAGEVRGARGWYAAGALKLAFGVTATEAEATGAFFGATAANGRALVGLTAARRTDFAVMPVFNVQVGKYLTARTRVYGGYTFQYLSSAGRLGEALNPGATGLRLTDFAVHALGFGADFRF
jgi:Putative beta barrel porin-7 (BBP7)